MIRYACVRVCVCVCVHVYVHVCTCVRVSFAYETVRLMMVDASCFCMLSKTQIDSTTHAIFAVADRQTCMQS